MRFLESRNRGDQICSGEGYSGYIDAVSARADYPLDKLYPCEIFSPNETELETFTGIAPRNTESCLRAVIRLASMVGSEALLRYKNGEAVGFSFYDGKYYNIIPAHDVEAVDTTAAGDIFTAALAAEYMRTGDIMRSVRYANVAGAISVTRAGALTSVPTEQDITEFIQNRGDKTLINDENKRKGRVMGVDFGDAKNRHCHI